MVIRFTSDWVQGIMQLSEWKAPKWNSYSSMTDKCVKHVYVSHILGHQASPIIITWQFGINELFWHTAKGKNNNKNLLPYVIVQWCSIKPCFAMLFYSCLVCLYSRERFSGSCMSQLSLQLRPKPILLVIFQLSGNILGVLETKQYIQPESTIFIFHKTWDYP